jgi:hypothetical protein
MFRSRDTDTDTSVAATRPAYDRQAIDVVGARGGVSATAVLTGVVVALGTMGLLTALVAGLIVATGYEVPIAGTPEAIDVGIYGSIALVLAQLLAYFFGGYTAGRMARGAGVANGVLVPVFAIVLALAVGAVATALGATATFGIPFETSRLPLEQSTLVNWGIGVGIASLIAMFIGGALGGAAGTAWHTRLEEQAIEEGDVAYTNIDLTDRVTTPPPPPTTSTPTTSAAGTTTRSTA